jgi:hypothetical protein
MNNQAKTTTDLQDILTNTQTNRPKIKSMDLNGLVQKEKRLAFYAGRVHSYREMVNTFHPLMSEELLECVLNGLENLSIDNPKLPAE